MGRKSGEESTGTGGKWYDEYPKTQEPCKHSKTDVEVFELQAEAKRHLESETAVFQLKQTKSRDSESAWLRTALTQGTTSDKVAAAIVLVQDNPKYNLAKLVTLVNQVKVAKHNQSSMIITSLRDLFLSDLLHPNFKLCKFENQNLDELDKEKTADGVVKTDAARKKLLAHWYFEDQLREQYEHFVNSLATIASESVDTNRETVISVMTDLLIGNAEQEHKLLELIVNKVGDPNSKVGSRAVFCLNKILHEHPNMKLVVLKEIEKLLFRKNIGARAQYYAICLLAQFVLSREDEEIAATLIEVYFAFFKACLKKGEPDSRMMAAILTGVNRAYPFTKEQSNKLQDHIDSVYKVVHIGSFNVSLNALGLLHQVIGRDETQSNRFYSAFYRKLLDPQIAVASKRAVFLNLLYRVLQNDNSILRLYAFIRRILQVSFYFPANMACATLYVVSKVLQTHKALKNILLRTPVQVKIETEDEHNDNSSDNENHSNQESPRNKSDSDLLTNIAVGSPGKAGSELDIKKELDIKVEKDLEKEYDPFCRNPLYAGVTKNFNTELITLSKHYHPSVSLFANTILQGKSIDYTGDPLEDLTLMRFLDRYVFKNPKKLDEKKVQRKNDPLARRTGYTPRGIRSIPVDSASYLNEREERIPVDELYLYRYLKNKREFKRMSNADDDDDVESVNSEEFNDVLDRLGSGKDFEELDVAADIRTERTKKHDVENDLADEGEDEDEEEEEDDDDGSDVPEDNLSDTELQDLSDIDLDDMDDDDFSDIDFCGNSDDDIRGSSQSGETKKKVKNKKPEKSKNKAKKGIDSNIFVSAEKFAEMLEEQSRQGSKHGGTDVFSSLDGASSKQIDWEIKRHQKLKGSFNRNKRKGPQIFRKKNVKKVKH